MIVRFNVLAAIGLLLSTVAQAGVVVDAQFGTSGAYTGAAVVGSAGDYWNFLGGNGTDVGLQSTSDTSTGLTMTWQGTAFTQTFPFFFNGFSSTIYKNLMAGYLIPLSSSDITVSGLTPDAAYDLYIYSEGDSGAAGRELSITVNGGSPAVTSATDYTASTFILGQNYLELVVTADTNGKLDINYTGVGDGNPQGNLNGFQLADDSQVPEPATMGLIGIGIAGLVWRRRHRDTVSRQ